MAKKLSRKKRKQQRQKQLNIVSQKKVVSGKQLQNISNLELEKLANQIIAERTRETNKRHQKREKAKEKYQKSVDLLEYKKQSLIALGFDENLLKTTYLRKVKKSDIEAFKHGNEYALGIEKYPFLYPSHGFNFDRVYSFGKQGLYLAWVDFSGEQTFEEICQPFRKYSNETLITYLEGIINQRETYDKNAPNNGAGTSSGRAGGLKKGFHSEKVASRMMEIDNEHIDKFLESHEKKRLHTGTNKYYQVAVGGGEHTIKEVNGRQLLILLNAVFYNITELNRASEYSDLYDLITKRVPDFKMILPVPPKE